MQKEKNSISKMSKSSLIKAGIRVGVGIAIVSSLGIPLVNNTQLLSERLGIPPFFISFVVLPFAVNFKTAMATIYPASQKKENASSIMFSEVHPLSLLILFSSQLMNVHTKISFKGLDLIADLWSSVHEQYSRATDPCRTYLGKRIFMEFFS